MLLFDCLESPLQHSKFTNPEFSLNFFLTFDCAKKFYDFFKIHFSPSFLLPPQGNDECIYSSVWSRIYEVFQVQVAIVTVALLWRGEKLCPLQYSLYWKIFFEINFKYKSYEKYFLVVQWKFPRTSLKTYTRILIAHKCTSISFNFTGLCRAQKLLNKFILQLCAIKLILTRSPLSKIFPGISFYFNRDWDFERRKLLHV